MLQRIETSSATTNPRDVYYYFNGLKVGDNSNNGTSEGLLPEGEKGSEGLVSPTGLRR